ncbi:MAG: tetratricopeptide repeat protein [Bacteroidaceae bacterium]|nr:tetratricopeptide repeat protein [Bacteroidaceae bacterium]
MKRLVCIIMSVVLLLPAVAVAQYVADSTARSRAVEYYYLQAISMLEQDSLSSSFDMLEHCRLLAPESTAVQYDLSAFYMFLGKDSLAHAMLKDIVDKEPLNMQYCEALVNYYNRVNDKKSAIALYEKMLGNSHSKSDIYMSLYSLYSSENDFEKALDVLDKLEVSEGRNEIISLHRVKLLLHMQDSTRALAAVRKMIDDVPDNIQYFSLLGDVYSMFGDYEKSERIYLDAISKDSTDVSSLSSLCNIYLMSNRDSLYCNTVERLLKNEKLGVEQRVSMLLDYARYKDQRDSTYMKGFFEEMLELPFDKLEVADLYVQYLLYRKSAPEEVMPMLDRILLLDPENRSALLQKLVYAIEKNDYADVISCSDNAILYIPDMLELYYYKGIAAYLLERKEESVKIFELGLSRRSSEASPELVSKVFSTLADTYHELGQFDKCMETYDSALLYNPLEITVLNNYAYYLALEGKELERALEMSAKTIEAEPESAIYIDTYAWVLFCLERYEEAKAYAEKLIQTNSEMSAVEYHHCGDIFAKCGDMDRAVEYWQKALELGEDSKLLKKKIKKRRYYPNEKRK